MSAKKKRTLRKRVKKKVAKIRATKRKIIKRKTAQKRALKKKPAPKKAALKKPLQKGNIVGIVTHYFPKVNAGVIKLKRPLVVGDNIKIKGHTTDFTQPVSSMQLDHVAINTAKRGQEIGLLVNSRVRQHDIVYKVKGGEK